MYTQQFFTTMAFRRDKESGGLTTRHRWHLPLSVAEDDDFRALMDTYSWTNCTPPDEVDYRVTEKQILGMSITWDEEATEVSLLAPEDL